MPDAQNTVFISYRRKPARYIARAIFQDLREHGYDVFMDVEGIDAGDFGTIIRSQIEARVHFLIILTAGTVGDFDKSNDWLRFEIEYAMQHKRNIVPLLIDKFVFNRQTKKSLTGKLADLSNYQAVTIHHEYFDAAMDKLRTRFLQAPVAVAITETPPEQQAEVERKIEEVVAQPPPTPVELSAEDYFNMAYVLSDNNDEKIAYYTEVIRLNPQFSEAYYQRGNLRQLNSDHQGAIDDYTEVIRLSPNSTTPYRYRADLRIINGDFQGAIDDLTASIRINPQEESIYMQRGMIRQASGDLKGAIEDYQKYLDIRGDRFLAKKQIERWIKELQQQLNSKS